MNMRERETEKKNDLNKKPSSLSAMSSIVVLLEGQNL